MNIHSIKEFQSKHANALAAIHMAKHAANEFSDKNSLVSKIVHAETTLEEAVAIVKRKGHQVLNESRDDEDFTSCNMHGLSFQHPFRSHETRDALDLSNKYKTSSTLTDEVDGSHVIAAIEGDGSEQRNVETIPEEIQIEMTDLSMKESLSSCFHIDGDTHVSQHPITSPTILTRLDDRIEWLKMIKQKIREANDDANQIEIANKLLLAGSNWLHYVDVLQKF